MRCGEAKAFTHAYVDGELAGVDRDTYEQHLVECESCSHSARLQARFKAAVRGHLPPRQVPERLRRRIEGAIAGAPPPPGRWRWQLYPKLAPAMLAAGALVVVVMMTSKSQPSLALQQAMRTFNAPMPMDVVDSSCAMLSEWFRGRLDFPVNPPVEQVGGRCEGARLVTVRDRLGAYLTFRALSGQKLGLMVFDGEEEDIDAPLRRTVNGMEIHMVTIRGASGAAFRGYDGLSYVVTGDLDADSLTNFLTAAFRR